MLLGRVAQLDIDDAVAREIEHGFAGDSGERGRRLHHREGVLEGLEVANERAGIGVLDESRRKGVGVGGGKRVPDLAASSMSVDGRSPPSR